MGSFQGHALPGGFFIVFALYWTVQFYRRLYASQRKGGPPFRATVTFRCSSQRRGRRTCLDLEWEGIVKIVFTTIGFLGEVITAIHGGRFTHIANGQHATMFFFFGLSGIVDILVDRRAPALPRGSEYLFGLLAVCAETVLFTFHLHGRTPLDVLVHTLLIYVLYATIAVILVEAWFRDSPIPVFARIFLFLVQGTWFWQVGFILYNPVPGATPWNEHDHEQMMIATMMFCWHMAAALTIMVGIGAIVHISTRNSGSIGDLHLELDELEDGTTSTQQMLLTSSPRQRTVIEYRDDIDSDDGAQVKKSPGRLGNGQTVQ